MKHPESIVDETWAILKNSINFHRKMPMKKGSLVNYSYIFEPILILSTLVSSAVCSLVKCKRLEEFYKASRVYSGWNMSNSKKNSINSLEKFRCSKVCSLITPTFSNRLDSNKAVMLCSMSSCWIKKVTTDPMKHPESIVDETWAIVKNSINFHRKMPMNKGSLVNNSYIFEQFFFSVIAGK